MISIYEFEGYKEFLHAVLKEGRLGKGARTQIAHALGCGTAFVSQVLQGAAHFSLEHSLVLTEYLKLDVHEARFFVLLVQKNRAGSQKLRQHFVDQITNIQKEREIVANRVGESESLNFEDQVKYYSAWYIAAIHVLLAIPKYAEGLGIAEALQLPDSTVSETIYFLQSRGLIEEKEGRLKPTTKRLHLDPGSPMILKHHNNWRLRALDILEKKSTSGLHFSGVWGFARADIEKIKNILLDAIEKTEPILRPSPEETIFGIAIDFFPLLRDDLK